eukprot:6454825-Amphidinium_carterae.1
MFGLDDSPGLRPCHGLWKLSWELRSIVRQVDPTFAKIVGIRPTGPGRGCQFIVVKAQVGSAANQPCERQSSWTKLE